MNKNDDKWLKDLHDRLEDYSAPLPDGLWEELEKDLSQRQVKVVPFWRKWQSIAAAIAVLAVSSLSLFKWLLPAMEGEDMQNSNKLAEQLVEENAEYIQTVLADTRSQDETEQPVKSVVAGERTPQSGAIAVRQEIAVDNQHLMALSDETQNASISAHGQVMSAGDADNEEVLGDVEMEEGEASEKADASSGTKKTYPRYVASTRNRTYSPELYRSRKSRSDEQHIQLGLISGGIPYSSSKQFQGMGRFASRYVSQSRNEVFITHMSDKLSAYNQVLFNNRDADAKTAIKHHMPINVAATVKWHFTENWALESGLSYTYLQSDLHSGSVLYMEEQQKLHYVGIPLKIHRNLWKNSYLSVYASAGGMVEKCVSAKLESVYVTGNSQHEKESTSLSIDQLQCSLSASLGAQVNFTPLLSLFVEPGAAYYFDDKSNVETIRKEHPFNFNLQFGLRFDISK